MMYAVIADVHFGQTKKDALLSKTVKHFRDLGYKIIWLGDTYDILCFEDAVKNYSHYVEQDDLFVTGNHDWGIVDKRTLRFDSVFLTHGDLVDFGYGFGRLQQVGEGRQRGNFIENLLCRFRKWSLADTFTFYNLKYDLTDKEVQDFQHGNKLRHVVPYAKLLWKLIKSPLNEPYIIPENLPSPVASERYFGYMTLIPESIVRRLLILYPEAKDCTTIVIGHLHHAINESVTVDGKVYNLICLSSWVQDEPPQVLTLDDSEIQICSIY